MEPNVRVGELAIGTYDIMLTDTMFLAELSDTADCNCYC